MEALAPAPVDHAALLDAIEELVCVADARGHITYVNRAWQRVLGYTLAEAAVRAPVEFVAPECRAVYRDAAQRVTRGDAVDGFEAVLVARDGRRIVARGRARPMYTPGVVPGAGPTFTGTYAVYRDVTEARHADAVRDRLAATLEASPDFVSVGTRDGAILHVNAAGRAMLGIAAPDSAVRVADVTAPDEAARVLDEIVPAALAAGQWSGESSLRDANGRAVPVALTVIAHPPTRAGDPTPYFVSMLARDLRAEQAATAALRASEARYRSVVGALDEGVLVTESDGAGGGIIAACNASAETILGLAPGSLCARRDFWSDWEEVVDEAGLPFAADALPTPRTLRTGVAESGVVFGIRFRDGGLRWIRASTRGLFREGAGPGALPYAVVTAFSNITAEREAAERIDQLATAVSMLPDGLSVSGPEGTLLYTNAAHDRLYGYEAGELIGRPWPMLYEPEEIERLGASIVSTLTERGVWLGESVGRRKDGTHFPQELRMRRLPWGGVVVAVRDVSERKAHEAALQELSQRDDLTGLFNRRGFFAHAERALAQAARTRTPYLLLYGDLDRFKAINDTRGHAAGDAALRAVARALREVFRPADVLGRLGGDEFVVVAEGSPERAMALRSRLVDALERAAAHDATALGGAEVAMSVGVAALRPDAPGGRAGGLLPALLKEADAQLYAAKAARAEPRAA